MIYDNQDRIIKIWNPDGKEVIAKENAFSQLRKTEVEKAYFNCHTDITIPYEQLFSFKIFTRIRTNTAILKLNF